MIPDLSFVFLVFMSLMIFSLQILACVLCNLFRDQHNNLSLMSSVNFQRKIYVKKYKIYVNFQFKPPVFTNLSYTAKYGCFYITLLDSESGANVHTLIYILSSVCAG